MMDSTVSVGDLLLVLLGVAGVAVALCGACVWFAAGMASAPSAEDVSTGKAGCFATMTGLAVLAAAIWALVS